jgi:hypothetical protein
MPDQPYTDVWVAMQELGATLNAVAEKSGGLPDALIALNTAIEDAQEFVEERAMEEDPSLQDLSR